MSAETGRVLIADDEQDVRIFVRAVLENAGYQVLEAADGEEALAQAREDQPDLVILDVEMPKMDGFGVFGELRRDESTRGIPVLMLTGVTARTGIKFDAETMGEYLGSEPEAYLDKPMDAQVLVATVRDLLAPPA
ncbi:MAG: response regulator [Gemmatimonadales bacterium]|nr:MAG: response regulator [Gemmatimonadales bacterium]